MNLIKLIKKYIIAIVLFLVMLLLLIYFTFFFSLFSVDKNTLKELKYKDKFIIIYYLPGNATSQSFVQITEKQGRKEKVLLNIERYNSLDTAYIKKDTLYLFLEDTLSSLEGQEKVRLFLENN
jgi:hypothetical protein